jgi:hypothetical protein
MKQAVTQFGFKFSTCINLYEYDIVKSNPRNIHAVVVYNFTVDLKITVLEKIFHLHFFFILSDPPIS